MGCVIVKLPQQLNTQLCEGALQILLCGSGPVHKRGIAHPDSAPLSLQKILSANLGLGYPLVRNFYYPKRCCLATNLFKAPRSLPLAIFGLCLTLPDQFLVGASYYFNFLKEGIPLADQFRKVVFGGLPKPFMMCSSERSTLQYAGEYGRQKKEQRDKRIKRDSKDRKDIDTDIVHLASSEIKNFGLFQKSCSFYTHIYAKQGNLLLF